MATLINKSFMLIIVLISLCIMLLSVQVTKAHLPRFRHHTKDDGSLSFLVIGDWGRKGGYNQTLVATQMGNVGEELDVDFIISTGDNFYDDGLTGVDDPAFAESFSDIYTADSLQKTWYNVLGNHDYRGDVLAQLSPKLTKMDPRWFCRRSYIVKTEIVDFVFVDTTPFQDKYFIQDDEDKHQYDWRGVLPREEYLSNLLKDVDVALKKSKAKWKFVIGHHTLMSAGHHGNTQELVDQLLPILEENKVDLYINGHDHCLEHISSPNPDSELQFLTSGGGSKSWRGDVAEWNPEELKLYYDGQGFMSMQVTSTQINVVFYDAFGNVLHDWSKSKSYDYYASS